MSQSTDGRPLLLPGCAIQPNDPSRSCIIPDRSEQSRTRVLLRCGGRTETSVERRPKVLRQNALIPEWGNMDDIASSSLSWHAGVSSPVHHAPMTIILAPRSEHSPFSPETFPISEPGAGHSSSTMHSRRCPHRQRVSLCIVHSCRIFIFRMSLVVSLGFGASSPPLALFVFLLLVVRRKMRMGSQQTISAVG